jgi:hypothetical protein
MKDSARFEAYRHLGKVWTEQRLLELLGLVPDMDASLMLSIGHSHQVRSKFRIEPPRSF